MPHMTRINRQRLAAWTLLVATVAITGCATTATTPATRPVPGLAADRVPAVPNGAGDELAAAWASLRVSGAVPGATVLSPADRADALGQTYEGFRALRTGDVLAAQNAFGAALAVASQLATAQYGMGLTAELQGRDDLAAGWFEAALRSDARPRTVPPPHARRARPGVQSHREWFDPSEALMSVHADRTRCRPAGPCRWDPRARDPSYGRGSYRQGAISSIPRSHWGPSRTDSHRSAIRRHLAGLSACWQQR